MSDKKTEKTKVPMSKKKKISIAIGCMLSVALLYFVYIVIGVTMTKVASDPMLPTLEKINKNKTQF